MMNIATILERSADIFPGKTAVVAGTRRLTYLELEQAAARIASGLASRGIGRGDRVALCCPNTADFPAVFFGILKTGASVVPVSTLLARREMAYVLENSGAKAFFCHKGMNGLELGATGFTAFSDVESCADLFLISEDGSDETRQGPGLSTLSALCRGQAETFDSAPCCADDTAYFLYTSGTTGEPKGAELSHASIMQHLLSLSLWLKLDSRDVNLCFLPLFHTMALTGQMCTTLMTGGTLVLQPRFSPDATLAAIRDEGVTVFGGTPTVYTALLNSPGFFQGFEPAREGKSLRLCFSGGAPMPSELMQQAQEKLGVRIAEAYGLSEVVTVACANHLDKAPLMGSAGQSLAGVQMRTIDEQGKFLPRGETGEIVIRGPGVMKGYWNRPAETADAFLPGGWFRTGDIGRIDAEGNVFIVDRLKDMILRGGFNVYPREVEEILMTHGAIAQAAVIGVPHPEYGEEVKAVVTLKAGRAATSTEIIEWSKTLLARYKYPRIVEIRDTLPLTPAGKILKRLLREAS